MKGILVDESAKIYAEASDQTLSIATLKKGDEFELGKVSRKNKEVWVEVTLPTGQTGFIPGGTHIFQIKKVQMMTPGVVLFDAPNDEARSLKTYEKNDVVTAVGYEKGEAKSWIKVLDNDGTVGYIRSEAKLRLYMEPTKDGGIKQIISGGLFAILGAVFYYMSVKQGQTIDNSMTILNVAIIGFGLLQLVQGIIQLRNAKKNK